MRKRIYGRRLSRTTNERKALFRSLAVSFFTYGKIDTTEAKAKAVRPWIEKLVTRAKTDDLSSRRLLLSNLPNQKIVETLLKSVGPAFSSRPGGYTRLTHLGPRFGDNAPMVCLEFVQEVKGLASEKAVLKTKKDKQVSEEVLTEKNEDKKVATKTPTSKLTKKKTAVVEQ
jgi:large subunit ribosomal protein L17